MATASDRLPAKRPRRRKRAPAAPAPVVQRCPFCHDDLRVDADRWRACRDCLSRAHADCWKEAGACAVCGGTARLVPAAGEAPAPTGQGRLLRHEAHLRAIAVMYLLGGLLVLGLSLVLWREVRGHWGIPTTVRLLMIGLPLLGVSQLAVSIGLWRYRPRARPHALVLIAFGLLLDLAQTLTLQPQAVLKLVMSSGWSVAIGWALLSTRADRIFHPRYAQVIGREGGVVAWWTSPFFTIPVLVVVGIATLLLVVGARALRS